VGDVAIAIASQGVHSNGFSLVRKSFKADWGWPRFTEGNLGNFSHTHAIYVKPVLAALKIETRNSVWLIITVGCQKTHRCLERSIDPD